MPTDPAGLVSQLEGARGTKLDPVILVRVRRSLHRGDRQSYQAHERGNDHALLARAGRFRCSCATLIATLSSCAAASRA